MGTDAKVACSRGVRLGSRGRIGFGGNAGALRLDACPGIDVILDWGCAPLAIPGEVDGEWLRFNILCYWRGSSRRGVAKPGEERRECLGLFRSRVKESRGSEIQAPGQG